MTATLIGYARWTYCEYAPEGMAVARAKGKLRRKQPKLSARQQAHMLQLHQAGEHTIADLADLFSVSRPTVYRALARGRARVGS